jgi:hypothetical protein
MPTLFGHSRVWQRFQVILLTLVAAGALSGCGRKLPPSPPDQLPTAAVGDLTHEIKDGRITLAWSVTGHAEKKQGRVAGFKIFRARQDAAEAECGTCPVRYKLIGDLPSRSKAAGSRMQFGEPLEAGFKHFYKVVAYSEKNVSAKDSNVVVLVY